MTAEREIPLAEPPFVATLIKVVILLTVSRRKMSATLFVSFATRSLALLSNATNWPLVEISDGSESPLPPLSCDWLALIRVVVPAARSRRKTLSLAGK